MKKCPFCKAELEENAQFCLYCMKSLTEKKSIASQKRRQPQWILLSAGVLLLGILVLWFSKKPPAMPTDGQTLSQLDVTDSTPPAPEDQTPQETTAPPLEPTEPESSDAPVTEPKPMGGFPANPTPTDAPYSEPEPTNPPATEPEPTAAPPMEPEPTDAPATEPESTEAPPTESSSIYLYRLAEVGDDFSAHYSNSGNDIVIIGIQTQIESGIYDIPAYIDGYRVLTIDSLAFYGSNAKTVYVPATVKNIGMNAFYGCDLQDIYLRGDSINISFQAFSSSPVIHCSAQCDDRNYRYFKNSAPYYGATWEEWNG